MLIPYHCDHPSWNPDSKSWSERTDNRWTWKKSYGASSLMRPFGHLAMNTCHLSGVFIHYKQTHSYTHKAVVAVGWMRAFLSCLGNVPDDRELDIVTHGLQTVWQPSESFPTRNRNNTMRMMCQHTPIYLRIWVSVPGFLTSSRLCSNSRVLRWSMKTERDPRAFWRQIIHSWFRL